MVWRKSRISRTPERKKRHVLPFKVARIDLPWLEGKGHLEAKKGPDGKVTSLTLHEAHELADFRIDQGWNASAETLVWSPNPRKELMGLTTGDHYAYVYRKKGGNTY